MKVVLGLFLALTASANALYSASDDVVELTEANFNKLVLQGNELWLVEFYAPWCGHCKSLAPEWKKAATALKGIVKVGAVDMDQHKSLGGPYNVRGFPTIKVFGANKSSPTDYNGQRTAQSIVDGAMSTAQQMAKERLSGKSSGGGGKKSGGSSGGGGGKQGNKEDVIELTDSNFEDMVLNSEDLWLVEFFAPWCGHCKSLAPHWASAATELKGKVKLGALDATVHSVMGNRYGVRGYPTIKVFPQGKKDGEAQDYEGGRTSGDIVSYALGLYQENIDPPELLELTGQSVLESACNDNQICVISILPHILDCQSECRNSYLKILRQMADKYKKRQWGWAWAEAGVQPAVEDAFGIGGFGYPAMAAMNARKMKFTLLKGSFSEVGINEYLRELAVGRGSTAPVKSAELPKVHDTAAWDGKDGEMPVEDDIDLSDVELDDIDSIKEEL